jgi:cytochrome c
MKQSDCFNCHAREQRIVGPSLLEIAARLAAAPEPATARREAVQRVRAGSTGVWGTAAMLPHPQHSDEELAAMVAWIATQSADEAPLTVLTGVGGELAALARPGEPAPSGTWILEASYTDAGAGPIGPLAAAARLHLRTLTVEAEHASAHHGLAFLESESASGRRFAGAIEHGAWLRFNAVDLGALAGVALRVSSAGAGAAVVLRTDAPDGPELARATVTPNGAWEAWYELETPLTPPTDRAHPLDDLFVVFENPGQGGLMNLDALRFVPRAR